MTLKRLLPALAGVALFATACGSAADQVADEAVPASAESSTIEASTDAAAATPNEVIVDAEPLAFAIQSIEDSSYSFEQGLTMELDLFGEPVTIGTDGAFVTGQFDDGQSVVNADIGSFIGSVIEPFGIEGDNPLFGPLLEPLTSAELDLWSTEDTIVIDLSEFASAIGVLDPTAATELDLFTNGPVSIDIDQLIELGVDPTIDGADLASQFGGAQISGPSDIAAALRAIDVLDDAGTDVVDGVDVSVFTGEVSLAEYVEATGAGVDSQFGPLGNLGLDPSGIDPATALESFDDIVVDVTLMIDGDDLVRQVITNIDMTPIFEDLADVGGPGLDSEGTFLVESWVTFDNYGADFDIVLPDAVDVTSEIAGQLDS